MAVARDAVFDHLKTGDLWNDNAQYVDEWYAIEKIDAQTLIIGEPKSCQYNLSYLIIGKERAILFLAEPEPGFELMAGAWCPLKSKVHP